jgi:hypothetical protein
MNQNIQIGSLSDVKRRRRVEKLLRIRNTGYQNKLLIRSRGDSSNPVSVFREQKPICLLRTRTLV